MKSPAVFKISVNTAKYSLCGNYLSFAIQNELIILLSKDKSIAAKFSCVDVIDFVDWCSDSDHILCGIRRRSTVQAFSLTDSQWSCKIKEAVGLHVAAWSPKGYHILTLAEYSVRISIWSLIGRSVAFIDNIIIKGSSPFSLSPNGDYLAVLTGPVESYKLMIFSTTSWTVKHEIRCSGKIAVPSNPQWSPDNTKVVIWETIDIKTCRLEIYSCQKEKEIGNFEKCQKNEINGIKKVTWSPNGQFLVIGCCDDCCYVLNYITWSIIAKLEHKQILQDEECFVYQENDVSHELVLEKPITFTSLKRTLKPIRLPGVKDLKFSFDGQYLVSVSELMPAVVWIWKISSFSLKEIIILKSPVSDLKWNSKNLSLLICSKSNKVTIWQPESSVHLKHSNFEIPNEILIEKGTWCPSFRECPYFCLFSSSAMYIVENT